MYSRSENRNVLKVTGGAKGKQTILGAPVAERKVLGSAGSPEARFFQNNLG